MEVATAAARDDGLVGFRIGYLPALNGFRGVGITTFMVYHAQLLAHDPLKAPHVSVLPGAFLWIDMFFVQSAFLLVSLMLQEWYDTGTISLRRFYVRRVARLLPALLMVAVFVAFYIPLFSPDISVARHQMWAEVWTTLLYINNWRAALWTHGTPLYPWYLSHAWSLSVEEQFYAIAPISVLLVMRARVRIRTVLIVLLGLFSASTLWMAYLSGRVGTPFELHFNRLYYATDTHSQGLIVGVGCAFACAGGYLLVTEWARRATRVIAGVSFVLVLMLLQVVPGSSGFHETHIFTRNLYRGGFALIAVCFGALCVYLTQNTQGRISRLLSWRPLVFTGQLTYGLYLWHWPVFLITDQHFHSWPTIPKIVLQIGLTFTIAALSWRFYERPIMRWSDHWGRRDRDRPSALLVST